MAPPATDNILGVKLPLPPPALSPNARLHWRDRAKAAATYRQECRILALQARRDMEARLGMVFPLTPPVRAVLTFFLPTRQRRDPDNLLASFKAGLDGCVDAGVLADDNAWALDLSLSVRRGAEGEVLVIFEGRSEP
jgi:crossover junction endodeoxyribonuclease RusA